MNFDKEYIFFGVEGRDEEGMRRVSTAQVSRYFSIALMVESKKGHTLVKIHGICSKVNRHLIIDSKIQ